MMSWVLRAASFLMPCVSPRGDVIELTEVRSNEPPQNTLRMLLLAAIRDGDTQIRLEQRPHSVRVFRSSDKRQTEDMPLNPELGRPLVAAAKTFPQLSAPINADSCVRYVTVRVGGHPVDLEFQWLSDSHREEVAIEIRDPGVRHVEPSAVKGGDADELSIVCIDDVSQQSPAQQTPGEWWLWYLECLGGRIESEEYRHELEEWARNHNGEV